MKPISMASPSVPVADDYPAVPGLDGPKKWMVESRVTGDRTSFAEMASKPEHVLLLEGG